MTGLAALQADFMATLYAPSAPADTRRAIYHRALRANALNALAAAYPVVQRLVGDEFFAAMAASYVLRFPSRSGDLNQLGAQLATFLERFAPAAALDYLPDVARLEWALHEASHAGDEARFDFAALASVPVERHADITLQLASWVRLLESQHPLVAIWEANQADRDGTVAATTVGPELVLVARQAFVPRPIRLSLAQWRVLQAISSGASLGAIAEALEGEADSFASILARHAPTGVICGLRLPA